MTLARSPWAIAADLLDPPPNPYVDKPIEWGLDKLGRRYWSKQAEVLQSVRDHRRTAVQSSHGVGKSQAAADIACWWLDSHPPGEAFIATTAPTFDQVRGILWRYIGQNHRAGGLVGRVNQTEWLLGNELIGFGRSPSRPSENAVAETVTSFQGIHAKYVLVLLDEACGIAPALWAAAKSLITSEHNRILAIGNPDDPTSEFEKVCREDSGWNVISISTFDTPNFTGEVVPLEMAELLPSQTTVDEFIQDYGEDSAIYTAKILGQFPKDVSDAVVPFSWAKASQKVEFTNNPDDVIQMGWDIGAGVDQTVGTIMQSRKILEPQRRSRNEDPMKAVGEIVRAIGEWRQRPTYGDRGITVRCNIDAIGVGWGVTGRVKEVCQERGWLDVEVNAVNVAESASDTEKWKNLRAELWWLMREMCHDRAIGLAALDDGCINELSTPKWSENSSGQIEVEKREKIVERLGHSPDSASSLILAPYKPVKNRVEQKPYQDRRLSGRR